MLKPGFEAPRATDRPAAVRDRRRAGPALEEIVRTLEEDIIFGRLKPRERLVEDALMERLGVTRHLVRQALFELERMGIVARTRNKGCAVRYFPPAEVEQIYEVREVLQAHAARRIALPAPGSLIEALSAIHARHSRAVDTGGLGAVYRLNNEFHNTLFGACGNPHLVQAIAHYAWLAHAIRSYRIADPALLRQARAEHAAMIEALRRGDRAALVRLCVEHIRPSKEAYLALEKVAAENA